MPYIYRILAVRGALLHTGEEAGCTLAEDRHQMYLTLINELVSRETCWGPNVYLNSIMMIDV